MLENPVLYMSLAFFCISISLQVNIKRMANIGDTGLACRHGDDDDALECSARWYPKIGSAGMRLERHRSGTTEAT
jgi:hypothetical protein